MAAEEHQTELVVGDDVGEVVQLVELGFVVRVHVGLVEVVGGGDSARCVWIRGGGGRWPGCGPSW